MKIQQVISIVEEQVRAYTDDSVDERYILDLLSLNRSVALTNRYNTGLRSFDEASIQNICVPLELVDSATCCSLVASGCLILKSKNKIPSLMDLHNKLAVKSVTSPMVNAKPINFIDRNRVAYAGKDSLTRNMLYSFIYNDYLYVWSAEKKNLLIESVILSAVFEDFQGAANFECTSGTNCVDYSTTDFALMDNLLTTIAIPQTVSTILKSMMVPIDSSNNAKNDQDNPTPTLPKQ
jgi:hypothetical protein